MFIVVSTAPKEKPVDVSKMSKNKRKKIKKKEKKKQQLMSLQLQQIEEVEQHKVRQACVWCNVLGNEFIHNLVVYCLFSGPL